MAHIYVICNSENDKLYVGQTVAELETRWKSHINHFNQFIKSGEAPTKLKRAMKKYGVDKFNIVSIIECYESELDDLERYYIKVLNSKSGGYNMTDGGGGTRGFKWSEESRKKLSISNSGENSYNFGKTLPKHVKRNLSEALSGDKNPFKGKKHTEDAKRRMSKAHKGKVISEETKEKHRKRMTGSGNHRYGVKPGPETTRKIQEANSQQVLIEGEMYKSMRDACKQLNTSWPTIKKYLSGKIDRISVDYEGVTYTSVNALAKHLGLPIVRVCGMIGRGRWDKS